MAEYEVYISANIRDMDGKSNFTIYQAKKMQLETFAELDELMARMRNAIREEK